MARGARWGAAALLLLALVGVGVWWGARGGLARLGLGRPAGADRPWFVGDFEDPNLLHAWRPDWQSTDSIRIVPSPVRAGHGAALLTLGAGDRGARKERVELTLANEDLERLHGGPGQEAWYAWSLRVPADFQDLPPGAFHIVGQWHHRQPLNRYALTGAPPIVLHLDTRDGRRILSLLVRHEQHAPAQVAGEVVVPPDRWLDLLFHIRWSLGQDGLVQAWCDGRPFTAGPVLGPTLYRRNGNYLRLGLYRSKGYGMTDRLYVDEVRIGPTRASVVPPGA